MKKNIKAREQKELLKLAKQYLYAVEARGDLETRNNDGEDFIEVSVWSLKAFMEAVYELGRKHAK